MNESDDFKTNPVDMGNRSDILPPEKLFSKELEVKTEEQLKKEAYVMAYQEFRSPRKARQLASVTLRRFNSWYETDLDFRDQIEDIHEGKVDDVEQELFDMAIAEDTPAPVKLNAAKVILEAERPTKYKRNADFSGGERPNIQIIIGAKPDTLEITETPAHKMIDVKAQDAPQKNSND